MHNNTLVLVFFVILLLQLTLNRNDHQVDQKNTAVHCTWRSSAARSVLHCHWTIFRNLLLSADGGYGEFWLVALCITLENAPDDDNDDGDDGDDDASAADYDDYNFNVGL